MTKKSISVVLSLGMILFFLLGAKLPDDVKDLHKQTKECREHTELQCLFTCKYCHGEPWKPVVFDDIDKGDYELCSKCHKDESKPIDIQRLPDCMLKHHQGNVTYNLSEDFYNRPKIKLKRNPVGLKLFCDPLNPSYCKVFCITCHKPMERPEEHMRVEGYYETCMRCHDI